MTPKHKLLLALIALPGLIVLLNFILYGFSCDFLPEVDMDRQFSRYALFVLDVIATGVFWCYWSDKDDAL